MADITASDDDDDETAAEGKKLPPIDLKVLRKVARTMWMMEFNQRSPKAPAQERKTAWGDDKKAAIARARKLIRRLESENVVISVKG